VRTLSRSATLRRVGATVLIVDDHAPFRRFARALLVSEGYVVVGEAVDGAEALEQAPRLRPEVALVDVHLPDVDGFVLAERLAGLPVPPRVVLVSSRDAMTFRRRLEATSACGFLPKADLSGAALGALVG
jgi:DNA-binding NarL/FixJ family response regulator